MEYKVAFYKLIDAHIHREIFTLFLPYINDEFFPFMMQTFVLVVINWI